MDGQMDRQTWQRETMSRSTNQKKKQQSWVRLLILAQRLFLIKLWTDFNWPNSQLKFSIPSAVCAFWASVHTGRYARRNAREACEATIPQDATCVQFWDIVMSQYRIPGLFRHFHCHSSFQFLWQSANISAMAHSLPEEFDESAFVDSVGSHTELYDISHNLYLHNEHWRSVFCLIGAQHGIDGMKILYL